MSKIISVVGARPNFIKVESLHRAFESVNQLYTKPLFQHLVCHTGQHYDEKMSSFFDDLKVEFEKRNSTRVMGWVCRR